MTQTIGDDANKLLIVADYLLRWFSKTDRKVRFILINGKEAIFDQSEKLGRNYRYQ